MPDFEKMFRNELEELATQAKVPYSTELTLKELRHELEEDVAKAHDEAYIMLHEREHSQMNSKDSVCTCTCPDCYRVEKQLIWGRCICQQCPCERL
jgi:hypothetical protein